MKPSNEEDVILRTALGTEHTAASQKKFSRRAFAKISAFYGAAAAGLLCSFATRRSFAQDAQGASSSQLSPSAPVEYIVIGSGAGGGPLACNLAKAGHKVVLIEAGGFEAEAQAEVPAFSGKVIENPDVRWDYYVRHYADQTLQNRDSKYYPDKDGVWYPRAGTVGGCTLHNILVEIYPSNSDWQYIMNITGDSSWSPDNMRSYFQRIDQSRVSKPKEAGLTRHGYDGWLTSEYADLSVFAKDPKILRILTETAREVAPDDPNSLLKAYFRGELDVNDWRNVVASKSGFYNMPQTMRDGKRRGSRDLIRETMAAFPNNLLLKTYTLVTRVLFDDRTAVGVEYVEGKRLYRADPNASQAELGPRQTMLAAREVIVSAGAFNSPQILKLSGIGPREELRSHGIEVIVDLPGVGENLQDRYEVSVITQLKSDLTLRNCRNGTTDRCMAKWQQGQGVYTSNGALFTSLWKTDTARANGQADPDLFIYAHAGPFKGYYHGYSVPFGTVNDQYTFKIIKAHTVNHAGTVKLRSSDPRDTPLINFNHFSDTGYMFGNQDLAAVVDGIELVRGINDRLQDISAGEVLPGTALKSRKDLAAFVVDETWGHHASCSNKMGPQDDPMAVVDSTFRVHGTRNLRVVDASVFPKIPGYFILLPIYIISQKASEAVLESARKADAEMANRH